MTDQNKQSVEAELTKLVDRFLWWKLPQDFNPDCGISFNAPNDARGYPPTWPVGTNLFTAVQAREMLAYVLAESTFPITAALMLEKAARICDHYQKLQDDKSQLQPTTLGKQISDAMRNVTPADAQLALDAYVRERCMEVAKRRDKASAKGYMDAAYQVSDEFIVNDVIEEMRGK